MGDNIIDAVSDARRGKYSTIANNLSQDDVANIWDNVSEYIDKQMQNQKGVHLAGLGTFNFMQNKLDIGGSKFIMLQRPVFQIAEKFSQNHGLQYTKYHVPGHIPVVPLNLTAISIDSPFTRDTIDSCVKEVLSSIGRALAAKKNVELAFSGIGRLVIREGTVKMRFHRDFIHQLDGTGNMLNTMSNRPGTVDSVMSTESAPGRHSVNTVLLPMKQQSFHSPTSLAPIPEINANNANPTSFLSPLVDDVKYSMEDQSLRSSSEVGDVATDAAIRNIMRGDNSISDDHINVRDVYEKRLEGGDNEAGHIKHENGLKSRSSSRASLHLPQVHGVNFTDDIMPTVTKPPSRLSRLSKSSPAPLQPLLEEQYVPEPPAELAPLRSPKPLSPLDTSRFKHSTSPQGHQINQPNISGRLSAMSDHKPSPPLSFKMPNKPPSSCGHQSSGQELCYLCHQRARRNIPVSLAEERKREQEAHDQAIAEFSTLRDTEAILKEQEIQAMKRQEREKVAAFNQGVSEAKKAKFPPDDSSSYLLTRRSLTPNRFIKQQEYSNELQKQCEDKEKKQTSINEDTKFLERAEQAQLAEDLAKERYELIKEKKDSQANYKKVLDTQLHVHDILKPSTRGLVDQVMYSISPKINTPPKVCTPIYKISTPRLMTPASRVVTPVTALSPICNCNLPSIDVSDVNIMGKQMKLKSQPLPAHNEDGEYFGKNDMTTAKFAQRRHKAENLKHEQQDLVEQRKRAAVLKCLSDQQRDTEVLERTKRQLLDDASNRHAARYNSRKICENDWQAAAELKRAKELEGKLRDLAPSLPLHEQCLHYQRCGQCHRRVDNRGKWNIWQDSRYVPGTRLMV